MKRDCRVRPSVDNKRRRWDRLRKECRTAAPWYGMAGQSCSTSRQTPRLSFAAILAPMIAAHGYRSIGAIAVNEITASSLSLFISRSLGLYPIDLIAGAHRRPPSFRSPQGATTVPHSTLHARYWRFNDSPVSMKNELRSWKLGMGNSHGRIAVVMQGSVRKRKENSC